MSEVIYGVDFRARREKEHRELEAKVIKAICEIVEGQDTAPSEYTAPEQDPA